MWVDLEEGGDTGGAETLHWQTKVTVWKTLAISQVCSSETKVQYCKGNTKYVIYHFHDEELLPTAPGWALQ